MKRFLAYIAEEVILEANYEEMFSFAKDDSDIYSDAKKEIAWAKKYLKKQDRITWYLRLIRFCLKADYLYTKKSKEDAEQELLSDLKIMAKKAAETESSYTNNMVHLIDRNDRYSSRFYYNLNYIKEMLIHYLEQNIPGIQSFVFKYQSPMMLDTSLKRIEKEYQEKFKALIPQDEAEESEQDVLIEFPDGWKWVALNKSYCDQEGKAMGHCGNVTGKDRKTDNILSLREPVKVGKKLYWKPHLTFILMSGGILGEMKGRSNDKPAQKYHKYIIPLLEDDLVNGIRRNAGYLPTHDFKIEDLERSKLEKLLAKKPELGSLSAMLEIHGRDSEQGKKIIHNMFNSQFNDPVTVNGKANRYYRYQTLNSFDKVMQSYYDWYLREDAEKNWTWLGLSYFDKELVEERHDTFKIFLFDNMLDDKVFVLYGDDRDDFFSFYDIEIDPHDPNKNIKAFKDAMWNDEVIMKNFAELFDSKDVKDFYKNIWSEIVDEVYSAVGGVSYYCIGDDGESYYPGLEVAVKIMDKFMFLKDTIPVGLFIKDNIPTVITIDSEMSAAIDMVIAMDESPGDLKLEDQSDRYHDSEPLSKIDDTFLTTRIEKIIVDHIKGRQYKSPDQLELDLQSFQGFKSFYLCEANYEDMFKVLEVDPKKHRRATFEINWAKKNLLKQDRITWFLKVVRLKYMSPEQREEELKVLSKKDPKWDDEYTKKIISSEGEFENFRNELVKLLSSDIKEVSNVVLVNQSPIEAMKELKGSAEQYKEKAANVIFDEDESGYETIVEFPNGWRWINLNKPWCGKEGGALQHCGNYPEMKPTDKILSLRSPVKVGGKLGWKPHMTAVLEKGNIIGQAAGRAMTKPKKELHPYIVELLINTKLPINGLGSDTIGAQDDKANFRITDLSAEDYQKVIKDNQRLA